MEPYPWKLGAVRWVIFLKQNISWCHDMFFPAHVRPPLLPPSHREFPSLRSVQQKLRTAGTAGSFLALSLNMIFPQAANLRSLHEIFQLIYYTTENQHGTWTWTWWFQKKWSLPTSIFQGAMLVLVSHRLPLIEQTGCSVPKCFTGLERLHFNIDLSQFLGCWGGCCRWDALPE